MQGSIWFRVYETKSLALVHATPKQLGLTIFKGYPKTSCSFAAGDGVGLVHLVALVLEVQ